MLFFSKNHHLLSRKSYFSHTDIKIIKIYHLLRKIDQMCQLLGNFGRKNQHVFCDKSKLRDLWPKMRHKLRKSRPFTAFGRLQDQLLTYFRNLSCWGFCLVVVTPANQPQFRSRFQIPQIHPKPKSPNHLTADHPWPATTRFQCAQGFPLAFFVCFLFCCLLQKILIFESFLVDGFCVCFWLKFKLRQRVQILRIPPGRFDAVGIWRNLNLSQKQTQKPSTKKDSKIKIFWSKQRYNACSGVTTTINTRQGMRQQKSVTFEHSNNQRCSRHHCHQIMLAPKYSKINLLRNHKAIFDYHFWSRCNHHQKKRKKHKNVNGNPCAHLVFENALSLV